MFYLIKVQSQDLQTIKRDRHEWNKIKHKSMEKKEKEKKKKVKKKKKKKKKNLEFSRIFAKFAKIRENARIFGKLFVGGTVCGEKMHIVKIILGLWTA